MVNFYIVLDSLRTIVDIWRKVKLEKLLSFVRPAAISVVFRGFHRSWFRSFAVLLAEFHWLRFVSDITFQRRLWMWNSVGDVSMVAALPERWKKLAHLLLNFICIHLL
ncbi:hypothetical protein ANCCAN_05043 [Ancylostoma caninum]|uniref:Uncharacterized protein n=1 Tax=Ancylostoma caninum TaxID=29170 RepID=A0A368GX79_ANCCA|nr:hypothetical protein ANCCAN_05043 [Ancylostoma caninum]